VTHQDHFLPAALIGGFGYGVPSSPRERTVLWRRRQWNRPKPIKAEAIGWRKGLYDVTLPGIDPRELDMVWNRFEPKLPRSIRQLDARTESIAETEALLDYALCAGVRHPDFAAAVNRWRSELGEPAVSGNALQVERIGALVNAISMVRRWRWRALHAPRDSPRYILNDRGWTYLSEEGRDGRAIFFPLAPRVSMLGYRDPAHSYALTGTIEHLIVCPSTAHWLNAVTWSDAPDFVIGHPADHHMIANLVTPEEAARSSNAHGPYRQRSHTLLGDPEGFA
jgi:hypothetical protein